MTRLRIVIPVLDEGEGLAAALLALAPLRARGSEVVVVDGGSTDATWAIACAHADRVLAAPRGRASQMNAGAAHCEAEVLLFLHADTRLPSDADTLVAQARQFEQDPGAILRLAMVGDGRDEHVLDLLARALASKEKRVRGNAAMGATFVRRPELVKSLKAALKKEKDAGVKRLMKAAIEMSET